jgi:hypothetical protein
MDNESDAKTTLLGAALHYNPELKQEVEAWVLNLVHSALANITQHSFERMHINNFGTFKRLMHQAQAQDSEALRRLDTF